MVKEYYDPEVKYMLWDDFQIRHIDDLKLKVKGYSDDECKEFDTTEDILQFYPNFKDFIEQFFAEEELVNSSTRLNYLSNYADTKTYSVVATEQLTGRLHVNENLFKPSPKVMEVLHNATYEDVYLYDLTREDELAVEISKREEISTDHILIHSGSSDVIKTVMSLVLNKGDTVLISAPSWNYYKSIVELKMAKAEYYDVVPGKNSYEFDVSGLMSKARAVSPRIIIITTPHNPTGAVISASDLETIIKENPSSLVIVDEAYLGFSEQKFDVRHLLAAYSNVVFSRTFSKLYGLAGIRVGYGLCAPMAKQVFRLDVNPFRVNNISRKMAVAALRDEKYYKGLLKDITESRNFFINEMNSISGVKAFDSAANFVFIHFSENTDVQALKDYLAQNGYLVRLWTEGSRLAMRVTLDRKETMEKVVALMKEFLEK
ncbi:histidinol-phosphate transaminase [Treponema succinifaciens]|nr:histidinol-phosphate transaminase [Treponema succinifaciens]